MTQTFHRDRFTWFAYLLFAFFAYFLNTFGPITPFLKDELGLSYTVSSLHFTAYAVGLLLAGLTGHILIERIGRRNALWLGAFGISVSAFILLAGKSAVVTIGASFCMGLVSSLILVIVPSALSDQHGELRAVALSESNMIASLVSTAAPLLVGWTAAHLSGGWRLALGITAFAPLLIFFGFARTTIPMHSTSQKEDSSTKQTLPFLFWVYWVALVLGVSVEFCMIFWSADYLENSLDMSKVDAAQAVSLFLGAMIVGRLAGSRLVQHYSTRNVVIVSILVAAIGFLLFWTTTIVDLGLVGLFVTGLGVASFYPLLLSLAIGATDNTVLASARATLASGTAILALPLVLGRLADMVGIRLAYGVVGILLIGIFLIVLFTGSKVSVNQPV